MRGGLRISDHAWVEFLRLVRSGMSIGSAARRCGFSRSAVYFRKDRDEQFANDLRDALEECIDELDTRAYQLAISGDADMLKFLLRSRRRHVYGDRVSVDSGAERRMMSDVEIAARIVSLLAACGERPDLRVDHKQVEQPSADESFAKEQLAGR